MQDASGDARNSAAPAMPAGVPSRFSGIRFDCAFEPLRICCRLQR
jgi:hypothetical protein